MELGISGLMLNNINFNYNYLKELKQMGITHLEFILPKYINWDNINIDNLRTAFDILSKVDLKVKSTQSILYNSNVSDFNSDTFVDHMCVVSDICKLYNIDTIILGSPIQRKLFDENLFVIFKKLDNFLKQNKQILVIEPNCKIYEGQYFFTIPEIVDFINNANLVNTYTMVDTHNLILENRDLIEDYTNNINNIKHIHISEFNLSGFIPSEIHNKFAVKLKEKKYKGLIVYESTKSDNMLHDIKNFINIYG